MKQFSTFLIIVLRRSRFQRVAILLLAVSVSAWAVEGELQVRQTADELQFRIQFGGIDTSGLVENLKTGHESRLVCTFQLFQETHGIRGLGGDRLRREWNLEQIASWDPLSRRFVLSRGMEKEYYISEERFLERYLQIQAEAPTDEYPYDRGWYVRARGEILYVNFPPPLKLFNFILPEFSGEIDWIRYDFRGGPQ